MLKNIKFNLKEVIGDFFDSQQAEEIFKLLSLEETSSEQNERSDINKPDIILPSGVLTKTKIDLLVTYASSKISEDNFLTLIFILSNTALTFGDFATAANLSDKIISISDDNTLLMSVAGNAHLVKGEIFSRQANWESSLVEIDRARNIFLSINENGGIAKCENLLGTIYGDLGNLTNAEEHFESALTFSNDRSDYSFTGKIEINLGIVNTIRGKYDAAISFFKRALINFEKISELKRIAEINHNMGMVFSKKSDFTTALNYFDECIKLSVNLGYLQT
ncbi:MAG: tetratricopeptide repeat protein, partial [Ignavibacteriaceae bacterium]